LAEAISIVGQHLRKSVTDSLAPAHGASYFRGMKRIFLLLTVLTTMATLPAPAQDVAALEERVKQLNGYVQDLIEDKANQKKQIEALAKEVQSLRDQQQSQPKGNYASQEDLRALAKQVQDIEDKRKSDREVILKEIENLGKASSKAARPIKPVVNNSSSGDLPDKAIEHTIASGDTLSTIAAAYSKEKGVKITLDQIRKANPGVKDEKLKVGQKILVPIPEK
jgi:LysM repeat protein